MTFPHPQSLLRRFYRALLTAFLVPLFLAPSGAAVCLSDDAHVRLEFRRGDSDCACPSHHAKDADAHPGPNSDPQDAGSPCRPCFHVEISVEQGKSIAAVSHSKLLSAALSVLPQVWPVASQRPRTSQVLPHPHPVSLSCITLLRSVRLII